MQQARYIWILPILLLCAFAGGCASVYGTDQPAETGLPDKKATLAVLPFHSPSDARGAGIIVSDILANQLYSLGKYSMVTPEWVAKCLADREDDSLSPNEIGKLLGSPYILTGTVTEYTYKAGVGETPVVGVTARLIDTGSGTVLWSATRSGCGGGNWFQEDSLSRLAMKVCKDIADSLNVFLEKHFPPSAYSASGAHVTG